LRITPGGPPDSPLAMAPSTRRCSGSARSSRTTPKIQLPSAITRPERIRKAKLSPSSRIAPERPSSMRNTIAAVQLSWVAGPCGLV
jgi:hypothetical protein